MKHDQGAPGGVETPQGDLDHLAVGDRGIDARDDRSTDHRQLDLDRPAPPATQHVDAGTNEQPMQPGFEPIGVAKPRQVPPGGDQGVLDRVSREFAIPEDEPGCGIQSRDGPANELRVGVMIAPLRPFDETPLVHCRLTSGATTVVRLHGMSDGSDQSFPAT